MQYETLKALLEERKVASQQDAGLLDPLQVGTKVQHKLYKICDPSRTVFVEAIENRAGSLNAVTTCAVTGMRIHDPLPVL